MSIYIKLADFADCQKICDMQRIAFYDILTRYRDYDTNPACETVEVIQNKFRQPFTKYYFIMKDEEKWPTRAHPAVYSESHRFFCP